MSDFNNVFFSQLKESKEYGSWLEKITEFKDNIESGSDLRHLYKHIEEYTFYPLKNTVNNIVKKYILNLLSGEPYIDCLSFHFSGSSVYIRLSLEKVPQFDYKPNCYSRPSNELLSIDFWKGEITTYDVTDDYKKAAELLYERIKEVEHDLNKAKEKLKRVEEISEKWNFSLINKVRIHLLSRDPVLSLIKKDPQNSIEFLIKLRTNEISILEEKLERLKNIDYLRIYKEFCDIQNQIIKKLKSFAYNIKPKKIIPGFDS